MTLFLDLVIWVPGYFDLYLSMT
uniref:Uncharacterized protein n=1 Tax=Arundo donax TaxID=35708 RepID=A0A0A8XW30_ARUDO